MKRLFSIACLLSLRAVAAEPQIEFLLNGWGAPTGVVRQTDKWYRSFNLKDWEQIQAPKHKWSVQASSTELCFVETDFEVKCPNRSLGFIPEDTVQFERYALLTQTRRIFSLKTRLQNGEPETRYDEVSLAGIDGKVTKLVGSEGHACLLTDSGKVYCWGANQGGRLGLGGFPFTQLPENDLDWSVVAATPAIPFPTKPVAVAPHVKFTEIVTRGRTSCALSTEIADNVYCWGRLAELEGSETEFAKIEKTTSAVPRRLNFGGKRIVALAVDLLLGVGLDSDGSLHAWGGYDLDLRPALMGEVGKRPDQVKALVAMETGICVVLAQQPNDQLLCKPRDLTSPLRPVLFP